MKTNMAIPEDCDGRQIDRGDTVRFDYKTKGIRNTTTGWVVGYHWRDGEYYLDIDAAFYTFIKPASSVRKV